MENTEDTEKGYKRNDVVELPGHPLVATDDYPVKKSHCFSSVSSVPPCWVEALEKHSERTRQVENVLGDVGQDQVGRDRRDLIQPRLPEFALDVVFAGEAEAAVELQTGIC